jgi:hypothetical protein
VYWVHALNAKNANIPLFETPDKVSNSGLAKVDGRQIKYDWFSGKKTGRAGKRRVYFVKPACDWYDWAKNKGNVRSTSHANPLTCWLRAWSHGARLST